METENSVLIKAGLDGESHLETTVCASVSVMDEH